MRHVGSELFNSYRFDIQDGGPLEIILTTSYPGQQDGLS